MRGSRGGRGLRGPYPPENHKAIGFLSNTGPDPLENYKATKPAVNILSRYRPPTLVNVNAPVVATTSCWLHFFSTGGGVKAKKLYLLTLRFTRIYKLAFILFVMTPGAQTTGNIAVYGSVKQLVIEFMVWTANPTKFWSFAVTGALF